MRHMNALMAASLVMVGVAGRLAFRGLLPDGNDLVMFDMWVSIGAVSVLAGSLLGARYGVIVPLAAMALSDLYINTVLLGSGMSFVLEIAFFTWTGFALVGFVSSRFARRVDFSPKGLGSLTGAGLIGVLAYDAWTNFGVWLGPFYPHDPSGLALCYTMAVPFTVGHLVTTTILLPAIALPYLYLARAPLPSGEAAGARSAL